MAWYPHRASFRGAFAPALLLALLASGCTTSPTEDPPMSAQLTREPQPATELLQRYATALNASDVDTIVSLYATDGVFMAQHRTPSVGRTAIEQTYREIFAMIALDVTFVVDEVEIVSPTVAWARTRSAGKTTILATGDVVSEGNQELFVLVRDAPTGEWTIGRYIFSTTQPPRG